MGGALAEFTAALSVLSLSGGFGSLLGGTAVLIAAQSLEPIATTLSEIGAMDWDEIAKGLVGMGGALTEVGVVSALVGNLGGLGSLIGSASLRENENAGKPAYTATVTYELPYKENMTIEEA